MHRRLIAFVATIASLALWLPATPAQAVSPAVRATTRTTGANYVAVGDSIAAGVGVGAAYAYPRIIDRRSHRLRLVDNLAVSGASVADVGTQLAAVPVADRSAIRRISLTVGGNDVGWGLALALCVNAPTACADTTVDPTTGATLGQSVQVALAGLAQSLPALLGQIRQSFPKATVYISSYYRLFGSKAKACTIADGYSISLINKKWLNSMADRLNATIRHAVLSANSAGPGRVARYVNAARLFRGHGFCDKGSRWLFGPVEVALGVDAGAIAHPNYRGQAAYARAFLRAGIG